MKEYEKCSDFKLTKRIPVIIRIDGKAFHTLTKRFFQKGKWDQLFSDYMIKVAIEVSKEMQGCNFCYGQSDEISFLLTDYKTISTDAWFGYELNKINSITSSTASSIFTLLIGNSVKFDSRAFNIPQDEVCNYFIWRQLDAVRNAIQMAGREHFSHKELHKKSCNNIQEMLMIQKGINFNNFPVLRKRGFCIVNGKVDTEIPIFTKDRNYIEQHVFIRED